ncbi:MAG: hypothetical protein EOO02_18380 [Chitinophagaceae bacterium]|nr:MAG: hypothetical protein EOO02_18380 [Chitinophagaceae bacterium]
MNWGYKIMIVFSLFVAGIVVLVIKSSQQEQQLVTTGYYEKELIYQQTIDARNISASLSEPVSVKYTNETIAIKFPGEMKGKEVAASIHLYSPVDEKQDRKSVGQTSDASISLNAAGIKPGKYYVKINWQQGERSFYDELQLQLP